uniref:Uncharacterized protein n=1 Tax=Cucumis melo TaxID=3656 RepID=A0A9I9E6S9_CUCME
MNKIFIKIHANVLTIIKFIKDYTNLIEELGCRKRVQMKLISIELTCGRKLELTTKGSMTTTIFCKPSTK